MSVLKAEGLTQRRFESSAAETRTTRVLTIALLSEH